MSTLCVSELVVYRPVPGPFLPLSSLPLSSPQRAAPCIDASESLTGRVLGSLFLLLVGKSLSLAAHPPPPLDQAGFATLGWGEGGGEGVTLSLGHRAQPAALLALRRAATSTGESSGKVHKAISLAGSL